MTREETQTGDFVFEDNGDFPFDFRGNEPRTNFRLIVYYYRVIADSVFVFSILRGYSKGICIEFPDCSLKSNLKSSSRGDFYDFFSEYFDSEVLSMIFGKVDYTISPENTCLYTKLAYN